MGAGENSALGLEAPKLPAGVTAKMLLDTAPYNALNPQQNVRCGALMPSSVSSCPCDTDSACAANQALLRQVQRVLPVCQVPGRGACGVPEDPDLASTRVQDTTVARVSCSKRMRASAIEGSRASPRRRSPWHTWHPPMIRRFGLRWPVVGGFDRESQKARVLLVGISAGVDTRARGPV